MNPCELVSFVTAVSCAIAKCVPKEELPIVAAIFGQIANTLGTIIEQENLINPKAEVPPQLETPEPGIITLPRGAVPPDLLQIIIKDYMENIITIIKPLY